MNFCSRTSLQAHEAMAGTGVRGDAYVFLPVPKRLWREEEFNTGWASPEALKTIAAARRGGVVTRLYNPPREAGDGPPPQVLVHLSPERPDPPGLAPLMEMVARRWPVAETPRPRLAVCTHGTRDRCCAKWGFSAYNRALELFRSGASPFEPIETSHLGGDRFAATGVFFPSGAMYAHLDQADLAALARCEALGRLDPTLYRGRVFEPQLVQVIRAGLARDGLLSDGTLPIRLSAAEAEGAPIHVRAGAAEFLVSVTTVEVSFYASCEKMEAHKAAKGRRTVYAGARRLETA